MPRSSPSRPDLGSRTASLRLERLEDREVPAVVPGFSESVFASGLAQPTAMVLAPDGRVFVTEKGGAVRVVQNGSVLPTPFLTVGVNADSERGLNGIALDPNFAVNGFVYVYYTTAVTPVNRVSRFVSDPLNRNVALTGSETVLVDNISAAGGNHNGGALAFAPDGSLFVGVGDAGTRANAQSLATLSGKILRVDPNTGAGLPDNPFVGTAGAERIWALGLRNPFTFAFQPGSGQLFINDVGQDSFEEVNAGVRGANYGWPDAEGPNPPGLPGVTYPIYSYAHGTGALQGDSIAGGAFYNPASASFPPSFVGDYFFGDFVRGRIFVRDAGTGAVSTLSNQTAGGGVVDLDVLPDGRLLYLSFFDGAIYQIAAAPTTGPGAVGQITAAGTSAGTGPLVTAVNPDGSTRFVAPVFPNYVGVRVATGDVNGDGVEDLIATSGPGGPPLVTVYDGASGQAINAFFAFDSRFAGGLNVAAGDVNGDGRAEIIVGTASVVSLVAVLDGTTGQVVRAFFAFPGFAGGVTVAAGDLDGDGRADIIAGATSVISAVRTFNGATGDTLNTFLAFGTAPLGVNVGYANGDILTGLISGPPAVATFTPAGQQRLLFFAAPANFPGGARVSGIGDQIVAGVGPALLTFDRLTGDLIRLRLAFDTVAAGNVFVG